MQRYITYNLTRLKQIVSPDVNITPLPESVTFNMDVPIKMRDGKILYANIFLPSNLTPESPKLPVIMSAHPYSKDAFSKRGLIINHYDLHYRALRMPSTVTFSEFTSWEAPDPAYWVPHGYAVINLDLRGFHKSKEAATLAHPVMFSDQEAQDYYDAIEWAAEQEWSNGKVGLLGVSYLAISQYKVAALRPPHLCAICPWEGFTDVYRDTARPGGIAETQFFKAWFTQLKSFMSEDLPLEILANETRNSEFYLGKTCDLKRIDVPALVVMSYSDHGLHTQGSMRAFRKIGSKVKNCFQRF
jgi:predicted acyl esterase